MSMTTGPVDALCRISETYGRGICREPQRLEAMLRDICPTHKREIFLLISALKEQVVSDLMDSHEGVPEEMVVARSCQRLSGNLGLTEDSARWAVESWLPAARILAATPDIPLRVPGEWSTGNESTRRFDEPRRALDWIWLALCLSCVLVSLVPVADAAYFSLHHAAPTFRAWITETGLFTVGLALPAGALAFIARQLLKRTAPNHWQLSPARGAGAMLAEVMAILVLPVAAVSAVALWGGEWALGWHSSGQAHELSFHLGRILQSLLLAVFLWQWCAASLSVMGRLGTSAIGRRS